MESPTATTTEGVQEYTTSLVGASLKDHHHFLREIGNHFIKTIPTDLEDGYIVVVEALLNGLYVQADERDWPLEEQDAIIEALSKASALSDTIKRGSGGPRSADFGKLAKQLGRVLKAISEDTF